MIPAGVSMQAVQFGIGEFALGPLSLVVPQGEYCVLAGPNGAGKSLLVKLICGIYASDAGSIHVGGRDVTRVPPWRRRIGYVPQDGLLFPHLTVEQNICFGLETRGKDRVACENVAERLLQTLRIVHLRARRPEGLSGGERQRVALARALAIEPEVLLLDEPVSAIDEESRDDLCVELARVQRELSITVLHVSHSRHEIALVADRVVVLEAGRIKSSLPVSEHHAEKGSAV